MAFDHCSDNFETLKSPYNQKCLLSLCGRFACETRNGTGIELLKFPTVIRRKKATSENEDSNRTQKLYRNICTSL
jgi:hypothetical protein